MKFIVGYQLRPDGRLIDCILENREHIAGVYFSWADMPNGRRINLSGAGLTPWAAQRAQIEDLKRLTAAGIPLNLLLNGNCYGGGSLSRALYEKIGALIDDLISWSTLASVTTASPLIARFVKENFPGIETRASVNMEIGTREGVAYLADVMDGYYVKREMNRDIARVRAFSDMCREMGKKVYLLANSGCLNFCSARTFHDNLVSHEGEIAQMDSAYAFDGVCRGFLGKGENKYRLLSLSNWIPPRDIGRYEGLVDEVKLATRVSAVPELIVRAYARGAFSGNLLDLTEPTFSPLFYPYALSGRALPDDFLDHTGACAHDCAHCGYCERTLKSALENMETP